MVDKQPTVYDADPHTKAKHNILRAYLKAWLPILARQALKIGRTDDRLLYVDGFAGAGEYSRGEPGSPIVAIQEAIEHTKHFATPVEILMIEDRTDRANHLKNLVNRWRREIRDPERLLISDPVEGKCEEVLSRLLDEHDSKGRRFGPALVFLDQFGYVSFSMALIRRILGHDVCEVFSFLNWNRISQFMTERNKQPGITKALGSDAWKTVLDLSGAEKEARFREVYLDRLREFAGAKYACPFEMRNKDSRLIYWLFFSTNSLDGLEVMKKAMTKVDPTGGFQFSDEHADQGSLFTYDDDTLAERLTSDLHGKTLTVFEMREYAMVHTPASRYAKAFGLMENNGRLKPVAPPAERRAKSFTDYQDMQVVISKIEKQGSLFES